jgi:molecular chaperone DnaK
MIYLGIDLGTTFSLASYVNAQGTPALFPDFHNANEFRTPSVIHIGEEGCLVGQPVEELLEDDATLPHARFVKLAMGKEEGVFVDDKGRHWRAETLSALILKKILRDVVAFTPEPVGGVIITVPANFNDDQRKATRQAAVMAGLPAPMLLEEPIAAATFYGFSEKSGEQTLFVYDLGGGTFDATVLQAAESGLYALATEGSNCIGGKNVDEAIVDQVAEEYSRVHGSDPRTDAAAREQLRRFANEAKLKLSQPGARQVRRTLVIGGRTLDYLITREQFEALIDALVMDTIAVSERCLREAGLDWSMVDRILLTGGSSLLPLVQERVRVASALPPGHIICKQPHQAVAYGAALIARQRFAGDVQGKTLRQIAAWDLGIRVIDKQTGEPAVKALIARNSEVPAQATTTFYTNRPEQTRMIIEVVQQQEPGVSEKSLGYFAFGPIASPRKNYPVEITLAYDSHGMVKVTARDAETGHSMERVMDEQGEALQAVLTEQQVWLDQLVINA